MQFKRFAKEIFNENDSRKGIKKLEEWFAKIGAPITLKAAGIPRSGIHELVINGNQLASVWGIDDIYTTDVIVEILEKA